MTTLLDQLQTQLDANLPSFNTVNLSWTMKPLEDFDTELPAALYYIGSDQDEPSPYDNITAQIGETTVTVLLVCNISQIETLKTELKTALRFQPPLGNFEDMETTSGNTLDIDGDVIWWQQSAAVREFPD